MLAVVYTAALNGIDALEVGVEVNIAGGLPGFTTVGLPENSVREARVRVEAAITNGDYAFPTGKIAVNLAPANIRKEGTGFDLPIALGILAATGMIAQAKLDNILVLGELSLSGEVRPIRGALAAAEMAWKSGKKTMYVAAENGTEAALVKELEVRAVKTFKDLIQHLQSAEEQYAPRATPSESIRREINELDLADVRGQHQARRALEIAAAGGHNLLFVGGPGSGKTMMARRLPSILPVLSYPEALRVTRVYSAAGLNIGGGLIQQRPFRAPHHSTTRAGLVGGGSGIPRPGELSLAMHGVLFLDEIAEFPRYVLEVLRQPLESGDVTISRANGSVTYPAQMMLVAAMNPCPCGNFGQVRRECKCSSHDITRYKSRLSEPLLDRIDIRVDVPPVELAALQGPTQSESSQTVRERVCRVRECQDERLGKGVTNATMAREQLVNFATPTLRGRELLLRVAERMGLSARSYDRILKIARTIADLDGVEHVDAVHVGEAIQYRGENRQKMAA